MSDTADVEEITRALARVVPRLARNIAVALDERPSLQLSLRQLRILERLAERPHRTSELAVHSLVSQPTASAAIAPLEARGLVRRAPDPLDRRASLIELTDDGRTLLEESIERIRHRLAGIVREATAADAAAMLRIERLLQSGMEKTHEERVAQHAAEST